MRQSHTAVIARNELWTGAVETEPYEVAWATEATFFFRALAAVDIPEVVTLKVQISPDGLYWCDHGSELRLSGDPQRPSFIALRDFAGWLRVAGELPEGVSVKALLYLMLKE